MNPLLNRSTEFKQKTGIDFLYIQLIVVREQLSKSSCQNNIHTLSPPYPMLAIVSLS